MWLIAAALFVVEIRGKQQSVLNMSNLIFY